MIFLLALCSYQGSCEVSLVFRLGSGAGATHSDSNSWNSNLGPQPRPTAATMPFVAFVLLLSLLLFSMLLITWTYLVTLQNTACFYDHNSPLTSSDSKNKKMKTRRRPKHRSALPRRIDTPCFMIMCTIAGASTVDSEALSASITPLRTYNPIIPLLQRITPPLQQLQLSLPYTHTLYQHPDYNNTTNDTNYDYYYQPLPPPTTDDYYKVMQTFFQEPG